jgi:hypothetical protein
MHIDKGMYFFRIRKFTFFKYNKIHNLRREITIKSHLFGLRLIPYSSRFENILKSFSKCVDKSLNIT